ncbi:MAG: hypothetical protein ABEI75_02705, partial [Halobaculum sp.]
SLVLEVRLGPLELASFDVRTVTETPTTGTPVLTTENVTFGTVPPTDADGDLLPDGTLGLAALAVAALLASAGVLWLLGYTP